MLNKDMLSIIFRQLTSPYLLAARYAVKKAPPIFPQKPKKLKVNEDAKGNQEKKTEEKKPEEKQPEVINKVDTKIAAQPEIKKVADPEPQQKAQPINVDEENFQQQSSDRTTKAEQANPTLERNLAGDFSFGLHWDSLDIIDVENQIGYVKIFSDGAKYCQNSYQNAYDFFTKPPIDKLLPDIPPLPFGYEIPKTLVINLTGTTIHTDYVFGKGAETLKRPGLSKFLRKLSQQYELVVLTDDDTMFTQGICEKLDPQHNIFAGRFGRESLVIEGNKYVKDLKYLNRPINRIVVIDDKPERLQKYPDNSILIDHFHGQTEDNTLNELLPLLECNYNNLSKPDIKDVRTELKKFGNVNPQQRFIEELKSREQKMQQTMKTVEIKQL